MADAHHPEIKVKSATFTQDADTTKGAETAPSASRTKREKQAPLHLDLSKSTASLDSNVYLGSYVRTPRSSIDLRYSAPSPRPSVSRLQLEHLLQSVDSNLNTYGLEELREGFFDASFYRPMERNRADLQSRGTKSLPMAFSKAHPLSIREFFPRQMRAARNAAIRILTSRAGIKLLKSFLGFFVCYIVCLIPTSQRWLGRYNYIMPVSAIINHAGRPIGSQLDGLVSTTLGTMAGLAWGSLALYLSTSTPVAQEGYGGILATFLVLFTAIIGWLRAVFLRSYQAVLSAGFAIFYTCLAETGSRVSWRKMFDYGIPWVLGQAVCFIIASLVFPDAGSRSIALRFHDSLSSVHDGLQLPREDNHMLRRNLALQFVILSQAVRDFTIEFAYSRFLPDDMRTIRNLLQAVIRSILSVRTNTNLFEADPEDCMSQISTVTGAPDASQSLAKVSCYLVRKYLRDPTRTLIDAMLEAIKSIDQVLLHMGGQLRHAPDLKPVLDSLQQAQKAFDDSDTELLGDSKLPSTYAKHPEVVTMLLFIHPVRQTAEKVEILIEKVLQMQQNDRGWHVLFPSYPWKKAIKRTNAQVRHDRGGLTAGFYFQSKRTLERTIADLQKITYAPTTKPNVKHDESQKLSVIGTYEREKELASKNNPSRSKETKLRYQSWNILHRLQGFESRFALKVTIVTTLLSVPAWLDQSRQWWSENEAWWTVVIIWSQMHPRVGGNFQDLIVRSSCAALGAIWGGLAFAAGNGSPYVMAVLAAIYMIPMLQRFTQSPHPRSGIVGCLSFTVVSLAEYTNHDRASVVKIAWSRGMAFVIGVVAALLVNWMFWPFVARHELRKSLASMLLHSSILYRSIISKYVYYKEGQPPGPEEIQKSEMLEGRLREGFVRIRQLLELTRHEMRLRAPFDPLPYSGLISSCEAFFEHLVQVRQSSLYFQPTLLPSVASAPTAALTSVRRDAVAAVLMNLYILGCALRAAQPIPKYLPSAAVARQRLLDRMAIVEAEVAARERAAEVLSDAASSGGAEVAGSKRNEAGVLVMTSKGRRRWADVYEYAYSGALTDIVAELQVMKRFSKEICGEAGWT